MPDLGRVHRFRDHAIVGVNWRPTRFVDEVHSTRVCALCRMIPNTTVLLPCSHVLCPSCNAANSQGCGGRCPLDQEPFEEADCVSYDLPTRTANALKVHCWNQAHGCEFEGSMEVMLTHYDKDCTFHTAECLRCGQELLHRALSTHYVAGCCAPVSVAGTKNSLSKSGALTLEGITGALQELETLLRNDKHNKLLSAIQCAMNEMFEQIGNQESGLAVYPHNVEAPVNAEIAQVAAPRPATSLEESTSRKNPNQEASTSAASFLQETTTPHNVAAPVKADMAQVPTPSPSTPLQERTSRQNSTEDVSKSTASSLQETATPHNAAAPSPSTSLPEETSRQNPTEDASTSAASSLKKTAIPENPESFAAVPESVLKGMRNISSQDYPKLAITYRLPRVKCRLELTCPLSTTQTWTTVGEIVTYVVMLKNVPKYKNLRETNIAYMRVLHTRDSYFTVKLYRFQCKLGIRIKFHGIHHGLTFRAPSFKLDLSQTFPAGSSLHGGDCKCYATAESTYLRTDSEIQTVQKRQICVLNRNIKFDIKITPE